MVYSGKKLPARLLGFITTLAMVLALIPVVPGKTASAISTDYPAVYMNIAKKDNTMVLTENGTSDGSSLSVKALGNDLSPSWRFDRVGADSKGTFFKITNAQSGRLLTPDGYSAKTGTSVIMYGSESHKTQHWYVVPVKTDRLGNGLYYKIVNYEDTSLALTQSTNGITLQPFSGDDTQLWLLNADGLQGFAGYCNNDNTGNIKAGDIGGLFGEIVEVTNFDDLKKYASASEPYTIVVTADIKYTGGYKTDSQNHLYCPDGRIYVKNNKTIVGSYNKHTLYNVQFCTQRNAKDCNNIIIKNFELQHDQNSNGNDNIIVYFSSGENLWVDHCTFTGHSDYNKASNGQPDYDKFLACCYDADYCTVSDSSFGLHEYGLILGYPDDNADSKNKYDNFPRMSLLSNKFYKTLTRGPGLMRWGYFHSFNNYVNTFSMAYTVHSGCDIYAENCVYENGGNVICDWNQITYPGAYAESGSLFSNCQRTVRGQGTASNPSYSVDSTWRPKNNYSYTALNANSVKNYCNSYSGCQSGNGNMMYIRYGKKGVPSAGYTEAPTGEMKPVITPASFTDGSVYMFKNVSSGQYMEAEGGMAANGTNVQQWGADGSSAHNTWKLFSAGDGYYYIVSCLGDGATYALDVSGKKADNGTNIGLYQYNSGTNQQYMLTKNDDGSYRILTRISGEKSAVEVAGASKESGANVQQWELNGADCQDWILESVPDPGVSMDLSVIYTFTNVNSGLVMDVVNGTMEDGANVQQWESNGFNCQKWVLTEFADGGNYYYIHSAADQSYVLLADGSGNGANVQLARYSASDSSMLFKFTKTLDGAYRILTRSSKDTRAVEIASASLNGGANVQQYDLNGHSCQKWNASVEIAATTTTTTEITTTTETTTTTTTATSTEPVKIVYGDADGNGSVSVADIVIVLQYAANHNKYPMSEDALARCDLNADNVVNASDAYIMQLLDAGVISADSIPLVS